ncbi:MAG: TolC family protein [Bacteroidetes bacterium]|nr:TolC family protein [Bacteroidota bacterium]MBL6943249.1 TolC family protein [Bacteroidales bacterium]
MYKFIVLVFTLFITNNIIAQEILHLSVKQAIDYAMDNNYQIINAGKDVESAKYRVKESTSIGLPQVNANVDYNDNIARPIMVIPDFRDPTQTMELQFGTNYDASLSASASQLIFSGEYLVGLQAARKYLEKTSTDFFKSKAEVKQLVSNSYYSALSAKEGLSVIDSTLAITRKLAAETREVYKVGFAEDIDVDQLELLVSDLEASALYLKNQLIMSHAFLKFYLGLSDADSVVLTDNMEGIISLKYNSGIFTNPFNVNQNIDFISLTKQKELSWLQIKLEKAAYMPSISANFYYQTQAQREVWDFFNENGTWYSSSALGINMKIPVFSSGQRRSKVKQATITYNQMEVMEIQLVSQLKLQYDAAKNEYMNAYLVFENKRKNRKTAEKIYNKTTQKYVEGMASSLDLLNTHNQFLDAENQYINSALTLLKTGEELEKILTKY